MKGSCEHGNEPWGSIKCWQIREILLYEEHYIEFSPGRSNVMLRTFGETFGTDLVPHGLTDVNGPCLTSQWTVIRT
jgi:hypothetical protein